MRAYLSRGKVPYQFEVPSVMILLARLFTWKQVHSHIVQHMIEQILYLSREIDKQLRLDELGAL